MEPSAPRAHSPAQRKHSTIHGTVQCVGDKQGEVTNTSLVQSWPPPSSSACRSDHYPSNYGILTGSLHLERVVSEEDMATIARDHMIKWEPLRPYLGLNRQQEEVICHAGNYWKQKLDCLEEWKVLKGDRATYGALITAAEKARDQQLADRVKALLSHSSLSASVAENQTDASSVTGVQLQPPTVDPPREQPRSSENESRPGLSKAENPILDPTVNARLYDAMEEIYAESKPELSKTGNPILDPVFKARLYDATEEICSEFSELVDKTMDRLKEKVTAKDLSKFVETTLRCLRMKYPTEKLRTCEEVDDVVSELLHEDYDVIVFYDIGVLERIIRKYFGETEQITAELKQYNVKLDKYLSMRICEHHLFHQKILGTEVTSVSQNAKLYLFMDSSWTKDMSQRKLYRLQRRIATVLDCGNIELQKIWVGSLHLCYNILQKDFAHRKFEIMQVLKLINFGVAVLQEEISGCKYSEHMEKAYEGFLENLTWLILPSSMPSCDWRGLSLTKGHVQTVIQKSQVSERKGWLKTLRYFSIAGVDMEETVSPTQKIQYLSQNWLDTEQNSNWWKLGMKLIRCCRREEIETVHELMKSVANYNHSDAPFEAKYVLKALEPLPQSSPAYKMLKLTEQVEFENYLRDHPNAFSWKTVAEVLYRCGEEKRLDILFEYMKSPEDTSFFLSKTKVEMVLQNLGLEEYEALYRELHCIPPPKHGSYSMSGIKLWLLTSPMRSWMELAWGLYRSHLDNALKHARQEIIEDEGKENVVYNTS